MFWPSWWMYLSLKELFFFTFGSKECFCLLLSEIYIISSSLMMKSDARWRVSWIVHGISSATQFLKSDSYQSAFFRASKATLSFNPSTLDITALNLIMNLQHSLDQSSPCFIIKLTLHKNFFVSFYKRCSVKFVEV